MKRIVICGGHLTPALALIEWLQHKKDVETLFFGRKYSTEGSKSLSVEYRIIKDKKIKFFEVTAGRLQRKFTKYTILSILKIPSGFLISFLYLLILRPSLIISFGGYLSVPVVFGGWLLGIDSITHEQATVPGLSSKINSLFVRRVFLSWHQTLKFFDSKKAEVIGNLTRSSLFLPYPKSKNISVFLKKAKRLVLVTGGNQGSHVLNRLAFDLINVADDFYMLHQTGSTDWQGDLVKARTIRKRNYLAIEYLDEADFGAVLAKASIVISRAGANTVWDLAMLRKPAILIPLPFSASGEQQENAKILEKAKMAKIIAQEDLSVKKVRMVLKEMFQNMRDYQIASQIFFQTLPKDATDKLGHYINNLLRYA